LQETSNHQENKRLDLLWQPHQTELTRHILTSETKIPVEYTIGFQVHRVVTDTRDHRGNRILEPGPWLVSKDDAEHWAEILRTMGYKAHVERMNGDISGGQSDNALASALASMA